MVFSFARATKSGGDQTRTEFLPLFCLLLGLAVLGVMICFRISTSTISPFSDAVSYIQKAKNFWDSVQAGSWINPLNLLPYVRPPGTILLSYPFGFSDDFHGYAFRSVFLPILLFVAALWIIASPLCTQRKEQWFLCLLCLAMTALPLFYHFEPNVELNDSTYFGLVDAFFAGVAALAVALIIRGAVQMSGVYTVLGALAGAFTLLVKPAALLVMALIAFVWVVYVGAPLLSAGLSYLQDKRVRRYIGLGIAAFAVLYGAVLWACFTSQYYSTVNVEFGKQSIAMAKNLSAGNWWPPLMNALRTAAGWHLLVFLVFAGAGSLGVKASKTWSVRSAIDICSAGVIIAAGLWFWIIYSWITQVRYFFPFALMAITVCFPRIVVSCAALFTRYSKALVGCLLIPYFLILILLGLDHPPLSVQKWLGVNLTTGTFRAEVQQSDRLIEKVRKEGRDAIVYCPAPGMSLSCEAFTSVGWYNKVLRPELLCFSLTGPIDWSRDSVLRFSEIAASDYIVFEPINDSALREFYLSLEMVPDFIHEMLLFESWLTEAGEAHGLAVESETSIRLLRVVDPLLFSNTLETLKSAYQWGAAFRTANPLTWIDRRTAEETVAAFPTNQRNIRFGEGLVLQGVGVSRANGCLRFDFVWESTRAQVLEYQSTISLLDSNQHIVYQDSIKQDIGRRRVEKGTLWRNVVEISSAFFADGRVAAAAVLVTIPPDRCFPAEGAPSDANGQMIIPMQQE